MYHVSPMSDVEFRIPPPPRCTPPRCTSREQLRQAARTLSHLDCQPEEGDCVGEIGAESASIVLSVRHGVSQHELARSRRQSELARSRRQSRRQSRREPPSRCLPRQLRRRRKRGWGSSSSEVCLSLTLPFCPYVTPHLPSTSPPFYFAAPAALGRRWRARRSAPHSSRKLSWRRRKRRRSRCPSGPPRTPLARSTSRCLRSSLRRSACAARRTSRRFRRRAPRYSRLRHSRLTGGRTAATIPQGARRRPSKQKRRLSRNHPWI